MKLDPTDRAILSATQAGLPLVARPFAAVAQAVAATETEVIARVADLQARGAIRRISAAPNHYALGMTANGMSVWDVDDARVSDLGRAVGALTFVTHCYRSPRAEGWPFNLFAMLHGDDRAEVEAKRAEVAALLGDACRAHDILYSTRILKKTGLRLPDREAPCSA
jgi:DNA-binding Lrp family transcriptional regulator